EQITDAVHIEFVTNGSESEIVCQIDETIDGTTNRTVRAIEMGRYTSFNRSRTTIKLRHTTFLRFGTRIDIKPIPFVGRNTPGTSVRLRNKPKLLKFSHFAAYSRAGHAKQLG